MGIGSALKKGLSVMAASLPVVLITFVVGFAFNLLNLAIQPPGPQTANTPPTPPQVIAGVVFILVTVFLQAGSMTYVREKLLQGKATVALFFQGGGKYYVKILLLSLIIAVVIGVFAVAAAIAGGLLAPTNRVAAIVAIALISIVGLYALILLFFAPYIAIHEPKGVIASLGESTRVVRANFLPILLLSLILVAAGFAIGMGVGVLVGLLTRVVPQEVARILFALFSSVVNAFLGLFVTASFMSFYFNKSSATGSVAQ